MTQLNPDQINQVSLNVGVDDDACVVAYDQGRKCNIVVSTCICNYIEVRLCSCSSVD